MLSKIVLVCLIVALMNAVPARSCRAIAFDKPNVLLITVDDLNTSLGCYGHSLVQSPNIDRLAREGTLFRHAYCQFPLCNPSRTSFMSGKRPSSTGVLSNKTNPRIKLGDHKFLSEYFDDYGYFTARVGKIMHDRFRKSVTWDFANDPPKDSEANVVRPPGGLREWEASNLSDDKLADGRIARRVIELIRENANDQFFIAAGFRKPHKPYIAPRRFFDLYSLNSIQLPEEASKNDLATVTQKKEVVRAYYACISFIDSQVGLILDELDRLNLREKTIIVFISDHGVDQGERNRFGRKRALNETVVRVPLILAGPGIPHSRVLNHLVELVDIYPTLAEMCQLPPPQGMEGMSMVPILNLPDASWRTESFTENVSGARSGRSLRTDRYRYTRLRNGREFLYDVESDPRERINLLNSQEYFEVLQHLRELFDRGAPPPQP